MMSFNPCLYLPSQSLSFTQQIFVVEKQGPEFTHTVQWYVLYIEVPALMKFMGMECKYLLNE